MKETFAKYGEYRIVRKETINHDIPYITFKEFCFGIQTFNKKERSKNGYCKRRK